MAWRSTIFAILLVLPLVCRGGEQWDAVDYTLLAAFQVATVADWGQTRAIADSNGKFRELNRFLGDKPEAHEINRYFLAVSALNLIVANALPSDARKVWLGMGAFVQINTVFNNHALGIGVKFK